MHHDYHTGIACYSILAYMDIVMEYWHTFPAILACMLICYIQHWHADPVALACTALHWEQTGFCKFVFIMDIRNHNCWIDACACLFSAFLSKRDIAQFYAYMHNTHTACQTRLQNELSAGQHIQPRSWPNIRRCMPRPEWS